MIIIKNLRILLTTKCGFNLYLCIFCLQFINNFVFEIQAANDVSVCWLSCQASAKPLPSLFSLIFFFLFKLPYQLRSGTYNKERLLVGTATPARPARPKKGLWGKQRCVFCLNKVKVNEDSEMSKNRHVRPGRCVTIPYA